MEEVVNSPNLLNIPHELFSHVLGYLRLGEIARIQQVCKEFQQRVEEDRPFWRKLVEEKIGYAPQDLLPQRDLLPEEEAPEHDLLPEEEERNRINYASRAALYLGKRTVDFPKYGSYVTRYNQWQRVSHVAGVIGKGGSWMVAAGLGWCYLLWKGWLVPMVAFKLIPTGDSNLLRFCNKVGAFTWTSMKTAGTIACVGANLAVFGYGTEGLIGLRFRAPGSRYSGLDLNQSTFSSLSHEVNWKQVGREGSLPQLIIEKALFLTRRVRKKELAPEKADIEFDFTRYCHDSNRSQSFSEMRAALALARPSVKDVEAPNHDQELPETSPDLAFAGSSDDDTPATQAS